MEHIFFRRLIDAKNTCYSKETRIAVCKIYKTPEIWKHSYFFYMFAVIFALVETVAGLIVPLFTKDLIDLLAGGGIVWKYVFLLAGAFIIQTVTGGVSFYLMTYTGETIVKTIRQRL